MAKPVGEWFAGPYRVLPGIRRLAERPSPRPGEIIRHNNGGVAILRCPACLSIQFFVIALSGPDEAPTFARQVRCSAGTCRNCGVWFRVVDGTAVAAAPLERGAPKIPAELEDRVRPAPRVPE